MGTGFTGTRRALAADPHCVLWQGWKPYSSCHSGDVGHQAPHILPLRCLTAALLQTDAEASCPRPFM